jgi:hypothetical protein
MGLSPFGRFVGLMFLEWLFTDSTPARQSQPTLPPPRPTLPPARKENTMPRVRCSNTILHPKPFYLNKKIYWWNGRPMCKRCYAHYCKNIRVVR